LWWWGVCIDWSRGTSVAIAWWKKKKKKKKKKNAGNNKTPVQTKFKRKARNLEQAVVDCKLVAAAARTEVDYIRTFLDDTILTKYFGKAAAVSLG
jgi:hypothetical protein